MITDSKYVLVLRTCKADMASPAKEAKGFKWPESGFVEAGDWEPKPECGHGLHGALDGEGAGELFCWDDDAKWLVVKVLASEIIPLNGRVKFPRGEVIYCGDREGASKFFGNDKQVIGRIASVGDGKVMTGGYRSTLTGGDGSKLIGGNYSKLTGGYRSILTGGDCSELTGGRSSKLTGGDCSELTGGDFSTLTGGDCSELTGGDFSTLTGGFLSKLTGGEGATLTGGEDSTLTGARGSEFICGYWDGKRFRKLIGYVGENWIEPNVTYRVNNSNPKNPEFVKVTK